MNARLCFHSAWPKCGVYLRQFYITNTGQPWAVSYVKNSFIGWSAQSELQRFQGHHAQPRWLQSTAETLVQCGQPKPVLAGATLLETHMRYLIALVFCLLMASPSAHACASQNDLRSLFFGSIPDPQPDADVIAKVSLSNVDSLATATVMQVMKASDAEIREGSKIAMLINISTCGPWVKNGAKGTIIAKIGKDDKGRPVLCPYTSRWGDGRIELRGMNAFGCPDINYRETKCRFPDVKFPDDLLVYAAGEYRGRPLDFQIDQSGSEAHQFDVVVNSPSRPVALMLGAGKPTIWNIQWTPGSKIAAVVVSGDRRQAIAGLDPAVPVLNSSRSNGGGCGYFVVSKSSCREHAALPRGYGGLPEGVTLQSCEDDFEKRQKSGFNALSQQFFGRPLGFVVPWDEKGSIVLGEPLTPGSPLLTSPVAPPLSFREPNTPLARKAGLDEAVAKGLIRPATVADADAWAAAFAANSPSRAAPVAGQGKPKPPQDPKTVLDSSYVVLKEFTFPAGLHGRDTARFFIAAGVPLPKGDPGHSEVYDFNSLRCRGSPDAGCLFHWRDMLTPKTN